MKKTIHAIAALSLVLASTSFAITKADMTILGQDYAKVTTCADLDQVRTWTNNGEVVNVFVMNDIDCGNKNFAPIGQSEAKAFEGIFDGNGKTISGLILGQVTDPVLLNTRQVSYAGFFGIIGKNGNVKNLKIDNSSVTSEAQWYVKGMKRTAVIQYVGAVVGLNYGVMENCIAGENVSVVSHGDEESGGVGGVAGRNGGYGTMIGCTNYASVEAAEMAGGIAGANTGAISTSINYGTISGKTAGGIVGSSHYRNITGENITLVPGRIAACQNLGSVTGSSIAGGIAGENMDGSINNCRNDGPVTASTWIGTAGGVVGYSYFDNNSKYESGNYTAVVLNSFSTTNSVTGKTVGGVVGKVGNKSSHEDYSKVENCYYDSQVLSKVTKAVGSEDNSTITTVKGETTAKMNTNEDFVRILNTQNGKIEYTFVWLFESGNYPVLDFFGCQGNYKITFYVADNLTPYLEATTVKGHIVEATVKDPKVAGATFKGWADDYGNVLTSEEAQNKFYSRSVTYHAVLNELFEITFVTDYGDTLAKKSFEKGKNVFYYDEESGSEVPADLETDSATYKFTGWDRPFAAATKDTTYTAQFEKIAKTFTVTFYVQGETYDEQTVAFHANAQAPADPVVKGFRFDGWDKEFTDVTTDLEIDAKLVKTYNFCYFDLETKQCETVDAGTEVAIPELPGNDSTVCSAWMNDNEVVEGSTIVVNNDIDLVPSCDVRKLDVIFLVQGKTHNEQKVAYGASAETPDEPVVEGYRFDSWDKEFTNVKTDLEINANLVKTYNFCYFDLVANQCETVDAGTEVAIPELPGNESTVCSAWMNEEEVVEGSAIVVNTDISLVPSCETRKFDVKFLVKDSLMNSQVVAYGNSAVTPAFPVADAVIAFEDSMFIFNYWVEDYSYVTGTLDVTANISPAIEYCHVALGDTICDTTRVGTEIETGDLPETADTVCVDWYVNDTLVVGKTYVLGDKKVIFVADCHAKELNVKFLVKDSLVNSQVVAYGESAVTPASPVAGDVIAFEDSLFIFNSWVGDYSNVTDNLAVTADLSPAVEVCQIALGDTICDTTKVGTEKETGDLPETADTVCVDWYVNDTLFVGKTYIVGDKKIVFVADCRAKEFDVKFVAFDTVLVDSQRVAYGQAAVAPDSLVPVFEGFRFNDWDADFTYVDSNMVVNAVFDTLVKITLDVDLGFTKLDSSFYAVKDTIYTGLKSMIDSLSGKYFRCEELTVNGEDLTDTVVASEDLIVSAKCSLVEHTVSYYVDDTLFATEKVGHGYSAKGVDAPDKFGKRFSKWDADLHNVIDDIKANAIYRDIEVDTIKVVVSGKVIDSIVVAKGDSVEYKLPKVKDTKDSTFLGWKVNGKLLDAGEKIIVKFGDKKIIASFDPVTALRGTRALAGFSIFSENGQLQVIGARIGAELTVLDLQGRVVAKKFVQNSVELISVATRGSYLVRVGSMTKRVVVR